MGKEHSQRCGIRDAASVETTRKSEAVDRKAMELLRQLQKNVAQG
jgi:hypothetical protein